MASPRPISRYASCDSRTSLSSQLSDASSTDLNPKPKLSSFKTLTGNSTSGQHNAFPAPNSSRALARTKSSRLPSPSTKNDHNFTSLVKKFMEKKSRPKTPQATTLVIPADFIAEDLRKNSAAKGGSSFHKKLFQKAVSSADRTQRKALKDVGDNTRTLSMVLKSERDLMNKNKELELEIVEIRRMLDQKNGEVEKLKELCLKQRGEIKALKNGNFLPNSSNSQQFFDKHGSELKQARHVIPSLQEQVTSLTGQLKCLAADLAEVKADKYAAKTYFDGHTITPRTPLFDRDAANSLDFSSEDPLTPGSPDDFILKDMNPCLTPYYAKSRSKDYEYDAPNEAVFENMFFKENCPDTLDKRQSMSPKISHKSSLGSTTHVTSKSDENSYRYGKPTYLKLF